MNKLKKLRSLSGKQRTTLARALLMIPLVSIALRLSDLRRTQRLLARRPPRATVGRTTEEALQEALVTARLVEVAARRGIWRANCLQRSLVLWALLRRSGIETDLRIGVGKEGSSIRFHAWLEHRGRVVNDRLDVADIYTPFETPIIPRGSRFTR
jgi:hypothetical protein